ncbi:hypothetical protein ACH5RR_009427 [Cinchona calisaya]|uniref:BZIP domain-containing protein n=1 Tax=Cinchona calisaya TaxID=153742 RepID=A0ABD3AE44_9GENT
MGVQTMGSHGSDQRSHSPLARLNSWFSLTLDGVENLLGNLDKPLGNMNLDELLKNVCTAETNTGLDIGNTSPASSLQRQASLTLVRAFSGKAVGEVWKDIQQGQNMRNLEEMNSLDSEPTLGETTLEDFLVKAGLFAADASLEPAMGLDNSLTPQNFTPQLGLSPSPSVDTLSDSTMPGRKRNSTNIDGTLERRLRRKIKNRESAARSRARKQAYHSEMVTKVSHLEEENVKLKKEKELEKMLLLDSSSEPRYQLRRTSSF